MRQVFEPGEFDSWVTWVCGTLLIVLGAIKLDGWPMWLAIITGIGLLLASLHIRDD